METFTLALRMPSLTTAMMTTTTMVMASKFLSARDAPGRPTTRAQLHTRSFGKTLETGCVFWFGRARWAELMELMGKRQHTSNTNTTALTRTHKRTQKVH